MRHYNLLCTTRPIPHWNMANRVWQTTILIGSYRFYQGLFWRISPPLIDISSIFFASIHIINETDDMKSGTSRRLAVPWLYHRGKTLGKCLSRTPKLVTLSKVEGNNRKWQVLGWYLDLI